MATKIPPDPRGGHSRVYWQIQDSMAWRALSYSSIALYMAMRRKLQATNNGNIEATITTLRHAGFKTPGTLSKGLRELQAVGLIAKTRQGGVAWGRKECNLFRFTDEQVFEQPKLGICKASATQDWMKFTTLADATKAIREAHEAVKGVRAGRAKNASGLQNLYWPNTETVLKDDFSNTKTVLEGSPLVQKMKQRVRGKPAANPHGH